MNRRLIKVLIVIWSLIAIALTSVLVYGIINKGFWNTFVFSNDSHQNELKTQLDKEVDLTNINKIKLDFACSDIVVNSTDSDKLRVVQKRDDKLAENKKCEITTSGNEVLIENNNLHHGFPIFSFNTFSEIIEIYIPKNYNNDLIIETASGDIKINSAVTLNKLKCTVSSGDIDGKDLINSKDINIYTCSGDINLEELLTNSYKVKTTSGDIAINNISGSGEVTSISGDIQVKYKDISDNSTVNSTSGDIDLKVLEGLSFEFQGKTTSGDINSNLHVNYKDKNGNEATIKAGNGPYKRINANTISGDINIRK